MDIYIKPNKKAVISGEKSVYLKDVAEVYAPDGVSARLKNIKVMQIDSDKKERFILSVIDIVKEIDTSFPGCTVSNLGEIDTVIEFEPVKKTVNKIWLWIKIIFISIILVMGASTAIMSFHSDAQIPQVFKNYSYIFFKETDLDNLWFDIPYSAGIATGIIVFFNHIFKKMLTKDPTPIEVEMSQYDKQVIECVVDTLNAKAKSDGENNGS